MAAPPTGCPVTRHVRPSASSRQWAATCGTWASPSPGAPAGPELAAVPRRSSSGGGARSGARPTRAVPEYDRARVYDTLTRSLVELPPPPAEIGMYVCGPTVYHRAHIGNARPFVVFSWLRSWLRETGYDVPSSTTSRT